MSEVCTGPGPASPLPPRTAWRSGALSPVVCPCGGRANIIGMLAHCGPSLRRARPRLRRWPPPAPVGLRSPALAGVGPGRAGRVGSRPGPLLRAFAAARSPVPPPPCWPPSRLAPGPACGPSPARFPCPSPASAAPPSAACGLPRGGSPLARSVRRGSRWAGPRRQGPPARPLLASAGRAVPPLRRGGRAPAPALAGVGPWPPGSGPPRAGPRRGLPRGGSPPFFSAPAPRGGGLDGG